MNRNQITLAGLVADWSSGCRLVCSPAFRLSGATAFVLWASCCSPVIAAQGSTTFRAGDLQLVLQSAPEGAAVQSLCDSRLNEEFLAREPLPLFNLVLHQVGSPREVQLAANAGWRTHSFKQQGRRLELRWSSPTNDDLRNLAVTASAAADPGSSAIRWKLRVENSSTNWTLWRVIFPQLTLADLGSNAAVMFPRGPGEVQRGVWDRPFSYQGTYPEGWCAMQFLAAYRDGAKSTGLYIATQDPFGSTKQIGLKSEPTARTVRLRFEHPVANMGVPGNGFVLEGDAVWQLLRGDWFDAAMIYRRWAQGEAKWWPRLGREGREDSPRWMRTLNAWAMTGGAPGDCVGRVRQFREFLGVPIGFHWYNWHQIPFDNDYPHYFPPKEGFQDGVARLKAAGVFPMPYINGRLWDSHDRGAEDFEFSSVALASVTKQENGSPYLESYGSKETNGQPVRLGVMCPSTRLWRGTVSNIVLQLLRECGTSAVYIDQVAAAAPKLCMDPAHGHPLGGGHWWTEGYWKMLEDIRRAKPAETMLTTECNGEPYIRWFDGYLTWHWQYDGQVPAFPAVYGGAIQMFGRAYRGGATKDLALRMKAGQQLVFGEQLGWLDPTLTQEKENADFFRRLVQLRSKFNRYFFAGQMGRPPRLLGPMPKVKADWQWSGEWWVSTDAVLTGAWKLPRERRLLLLFVNVSDAPVTAAVELDQRSWGLPKGPLRAKVTSTGGEPPTGTTGGFETPTLFAAGQPQAWEIAY